jgi:hypothetical protein
MNPGIGKSLPGVELWKCFGIIVEGQWEGYPERVICSSHVIW